ncbi:hypothetical protein EDB89DRAFT_1910454 [Lactarius sanguifluus]|nr:hypothetical protein EDB89DRAFT_1910454 [Lactarius sanguifluus]
MQSLCDTRRSFETHCLEQEQESGNAVLMCAYMAQKFNAAITKRGRLGLRYPTNGTTGRAEPPPRHDYRQPWMLSRRNNLHRVVLLKLWRCGIGLKHLQCRRLTSAIRPSGAASHALPAHLVGGQRRTILRSRPYLLHYVVLVGKNESDAIMVVKLDEFSGFAGIGRVSRRSLKTHALEGTSLNSQDTEKTLAFVISTMLERVNF